MVDLLYFVFGLTNFVFLHWFTWPCNEHLAVAYLEKACSNYPSSQTFEHWVIEDPNLPQVGLKQMAKHTGSFTGASGELHMHIGCGPILRMIQTIHLLRPCVTHLKNIKHPLLVEFHLQDKSIVSWEIPIYPHLGFGKFLPNKIQYQTKEVIGFGREMITAHFYIVSLKRTDPLLTIAICHPWQTFFVWHIHPRSWHIAKFVWWSRPSDLWSPPNIGHCPKNFIHLILSIYNFEFRFLSHERCRSY